MSRKLNEIKDSDYRELSYKCRDLVDHFGDAVESAKDITDIDCEVVLKDEDGDKVKRTYYVLTDYERTKLVAEWIEYDLESYMSFDKILDYAIDNLYRDRVVDTLVDYGIIREDFRSNYFGTIREETDLQDIPEKLYDTLVNYIDEDENLCSDTIEKLDSFSLVSLANDLGLIDEETLSKFTSDTQDFSLDDDNDIDLDVTNSDVLPEDDRKKLISRIINLICDSMYDMMYAKYESLDNDDLIEQLRDRGYIEDLNELKFYADIDGIIDDYVDSFYDDDFTNILCYSGDYDACFETDAYYFYEIRYEVIEEEPEEPELDVESNVEDKPEESLNESVDSNTKEELLKNYLIEVKQYENVEINHKDDYDYSVNYTFYDEDKTTYTDEYIILTKEERREEEFYNLDNSFDDKHLCEVIENDSDYYLNYPKVVKIGNIKDMYCNEDDVINYILNDDTSVKNVIHYYTNLDANELDISDDIEFNVLYNEESEIENYSLVDLLNLAEFLGIDTNNFKTDYQDFSLDDLDDYSKEDTSIQTYKFKDYDMYGDVYKLGSEIADKIIDYVLDRREVNINNCSNGFEVLDLYIEYFYGYSIRNDLNCVLNFILDMDSFDTFFDRSAIINAIIDTFTDENFGEEFASEDYEQLLLQDSYDNKEPVYAYLTYTNR